MKAVQHFTSTWQPDKQYERQAFHDSFRATLGEIFDEIERRVSRGPATTALNEIRKELECERKRPCCRKCGEALKESIVVSDLCGLCYDDKRNGR